MDFSFIGNNPNPQNVSNNAANPNPINNFFDLNSNQNVNQQPPKSTNLDMDSLLKSKLI